MPAPVADGPAGHSANPSDPPAAIVVAPVAATRAIHAAYQSAVQQLKLPHVAFKIVRQMQSGNSHFRIRLDPPELGRIEVKLDIDRTGTVNARLTVERADTLDLMQRDRQVLERALAQAGLDTSKINLEFSLRQNPSGYESGALWLSARQRNPWPFALCLRRRFRAGYDSQIRSPGTPQLLQGRYLAEQGF